MNAATPSAVSVPQPGAGRRAWWPRLAWAAGALLCVVLYALLLWGLDRRALGVAPGAYRTLANVGLNAAVALPWVLLLWGLTRRLFSSLLLVLLLQAAACQASMVKQQVLGTPLILQDFYLLTSFNRASLEVLGSYLEDARAFALACVAGLVAVVAAFRIESPVPRRAGAASVTVLAAGLALALSQSLATWPWTAVYTREHVRPSALGPEPAVLRAGLMSSLVYKHLEVANTVYKLDEEALRAVLAATAAERAGGAAAPASGELPDIVVVLSESFMDPHILSGMEALGDVIPGARALIRQGAGGEMVVPTYGGGTVRTEFEVLTGMPVSAFPSVIYPYADMSARRMPGLPLLLRGRGYATVAIHANSGAFWNRTDTYKSMGIDRFLTERAFREGGKKDGGWYSDASMTDLVLRELERADRPLLVVAVSMENHGPYDSRAPVLDEAARAAIRLPEGLPDGAATGLRNYLYHLANADRELVRLLDGLRARGRPFVVVFFGDHLPALPEAYEALSFVDGRRAQEQTVPWLIVGDAGRRAAGRRLHAWELAAEALEVAGIGGDPYYDLVRVAGRRLAVLPPGSEEARLLRRGVEAAAVAQFQGRFEEFLR